MLAHAAGIRPSAPLRGPPLFFWGMAALVDLAAGSCGSPTVGAIHAVLGVLFLASSLRDVRTLRSLDGRA
ncbi:hypothetical protein OJF2_69390 [Aquisphaera giovannonii]|uniref:Uncharacterized protein n=1 Tax=Aquisphaera giovannonii TaxID=406548 RepID=A0A5B9WCE1_9BACT|nr:hypothetical protein OJF2_69390 [Aquisphaera giovannonii]